MVLNNALDKVSDLLFSIFHDFEVFFLDITCEEVGNAYAALEAFFRDVRRDFDLLFFKVLLELFELLFGKFLLSDETEDSLGFEFSEGGGSLVVGVEFADTDFSGGFKYNSLIIFSQAFNEVLFHFVFIELETEVDVERSQEDFFSEVVFIVEFLSLFSIVEFDFDESILGVE